MSTTDHRHGKRAASAAALFVCLLALHPVAVLPTAPPVAAKSSTTSGMAREPLWLVTNRGEHTITVEIADTPERTAVGLMFRTELPETEGMLFPDDEPRHMSMWMKNTYIPLDMVFIRADGIVHRIEAMTEPFSEREIVSGIPVLAVLELKGGVAAKLGLKPGDRVRHRIFGTAP
jgi:hypothetical protein